MQMTYCARAIGLTLCLTSATLNAAEVIDKVTLQKKLNSIGAKQMVSPHVLMAIIATTSKMHIDYVEMPEKPTKSMVGLMGISCGLAMKHDKTLTHDNCVEKLKNPDVSIGLGNAILFSYSTTCEQDAKCIFEKWFGEKSTAKVNQAFGAYTLSVLLNTPTKK